VQVADRDDQVDGICPIIGGIIDVLVYSSYIGADLGFQSRIGDKTQCVPFSFGCRG
jgi:hypothetical protein